jgi:hypothetical protein
MPRRTDVSAAFQVAMEKLTAAGHVVERRHKAAIKKIEEITGRTFDGDMYTFFTDYTRSNEPTGRFVKMDRQYKHSTQMKQVMRRLEGMPVRISILSRAKDW